jgi:thioredoxin 1
MAAEVTITADNFEREVLQSDIPVLTDFWAEWCMPCKMVAPVLKEIAEAYAGKVKIAKIDVDTLPDLAQQYRVVSIPMLLLFKGGKVVNQHLGAASKATIERIFADYV